MGETSQPSSDPGKLRLVGRGPRGSVTLRFAGSDVVPRDRGRPAASHPFTPETSTGLEPTDPRWVLAVRTQQVLQGTVLRPGDRQELLRVGKLLGLSPFDANLVVAIVQDRARRGGGLGDTADSLQRVPLRERRVGSPLAWRVLRWCAAALAVELLLVWAII